MEFAEVASMSMELLAGPFLPASAGGLYSDQEAARARVEHLEGILRFWPYMAVVDAFRHWAYTHPDAAAEPASCEASWSALWRRFMCGVDRYALSLGGTADLPGLYAAAGARFAFDPATLREAVELIERTIAELDGEAA